MEELELIEYVKITLFLVFRRSDSYLHGARNTEHAARSTDEMARGVNALYGT